MRHAAVVFGENFYLFIVDPHRRAQTNVTADPVHCLHVPDRTVAESLHTELFLVFGFGEMRVK